MAKRYVKRYYIRPQNIFCSNKAEILNALVKEVGENNCSVYSLKALDDHDDVHLLQPKDIIYYYDDGILYDKNHVKVMDYDLNVKHEEERKRFGNVDAISDQTFDAEYEDRLTEAVTLKNFSAEDAKKLDSQVEQDLKQKSEKFLNKYLAGQEIVFKTRYRPTTYGNNKYQFSSRKEKISKVFIGAQSNKLRVKTDKKSYLLTDLIDALRKWVDNYKIEENDNRYIVTTLEDWIECIWNPEVKRQQSEINAVSRREYKLNLAYNAVENLTPAEFEEVTTWLALHTIGIHFRVPKIDDDLVKLNTSEMSLERADKERDRIIRKFSRQEAEFYNEFPKAVLNKHFTYRKTSKEKDTNYLRWNLAGSIYFDTTIASAPATVITLIERARETAIKNGHEVKPIEKVKEADFLDSYYFCLMAVKLFEGDLDFFNNKKLFVQKEVQPEHEFALAFESINAYGENLTEAAHNTFICCICGEESEGYGNNPDPIRSSGECCDACNRKFVIPARLGFDIED